MLRDKTPDRIINHYHQGVRRIPEAKAAAAYLSALAAAFFGQYDRARQELDAVDWTTTTPHVSGTSHVRACSVGLAGRNGLSEGASPGP